MISSGQSIEFKGVAGKILRNKEVGLQFVATEFAFGWF